MGNSVPVRKSITKAQARLAYNRCDAECFYCQTSIAPFEHRATRWEIDHLHPVKHGGANSSRNYVASCHSCNAFKKARHVYEFLQLRGITTRRCMYVMVDPTTKHQHFCRTRYETLEERYCLEHQKPVPNTQECSFHSLFWCLCCCFAGCKQIAKADTNMQPEEKQQEPTIPHFATEI